MAEKIEANAKKRDYYLQIMQKARQLNDQPLIEIVLNKLARLGTTGAVTTTSGCIIIPFPIVHCSTRPAVYDQPSLWTIIKLTLAIPGSLVALMLLAFYRWGPGVSGIW